MDKQTPQQGKWIDLRTVEIFYGGLTLWASWCLLTPPSNFADTSPEAYYFAEKLGFSEPALGWFIGIGGALELIGLAFLWVHPDHSSSVGWFLRVLGMSIGAIFFLTTGMSWWIYRPDSIAGPIIVGLGYRGLQVLYYKAFRM